MGMEVCGDAIRKARGRWRGTGDVGENISFRLLPYKNTYCTKSRNGGKEESLGHNTKKNQKQRNKKKQKQKTNATDTTRALERNQPRKDPIRLSVTS